MAKLAVIARKRLKEDIRVQQIRPIADNIPYIGKRMSVIHAIEDVARRGARITYGKLGRIVSIPAQGPWKPLLDEIGRDYVDRDLPDITYLVVRSDTMYPSQIDFVDARKPTPEQKQKADEVIRRVHAAYARPEKPTS